LGTQESSFGAKQAIHIAWELPDEKLSDGRPAAIGRRYNLSTAPKAALRADLEGWLGRELSSADLDNFDLADLLGSTCQLNVRHTSGGSGDRVFANVVAVLPPPRGVPVKQRPFNRPVALSLADRPFPRLEFEALPEWLRTTIAKSPEYAAAIGEAARQPAREVLRDRGFEAAPGRLEPTVGTGKWSTPAAYGEVMDDDLPFITCDPAREPYLKWRTVA
jgi:hypothetical protein